jgi:hypothetical protein
MNEDNLVDDWCFELGLENEGWLNKGEWGNAYRISDDKVIKITRDYEEFICSYNLLNKDTSYNAKIYNMRVFPNGELGILMEHVGTDTIEDVFSGLLAFAEENEIDIFDVNEEYSGLVSDEVIKMSTDLYQAYQEISSSGYYGSHALDIHDGNIGINAEGNYVLFDQRDKSSPVFDDFDLFNEIKEKLKEKYFISDNDLIPKQIPIERITVSETSITKTLNDIANKRYSQTNSPIELMYNSEGNLQITDGYHRFCEALLLNKEEVESIIVYDERCGYPNQTYAEVKKEGSLNIDHDQLFSGLENVADEDYLAHIHSEYIALNSINLKTISFNSLYHIGTLKKENKSDTSLEGINGISISSDSNIWGEINDIHANGDTFEFTKKDNIFVEAHSLSQKTKDLIMEWGVENGFLSSTTKYKYEYYDEDTELDSFFVFDTLDEALDDYNYDDLTIFKEYNATQKFKDIVGENNAWNLELMLSVYANTTTNFDGVYWNDESNKSKYSAPRGIIFEDKISSWSVNNLSLKSKKSLDSLLNNISKPEPKKQAISSPKIRNHS